MNKMGLDSYTVPMSSWWDGCEPESDISQKKDSLPVPGMLCIDAGTYGTAYFSYGFPLRALQSDGGGLTSEGEDYQGGQRADPGPQRYSHCHQPDCLYHISDP